MKRCARCRRRKPKSEFYKSKKNPDGLYSYCQPCARKQRLAYIHADPKRHYDARRVARSQMRQRIWDYLRTHPCITCGETDPVVLEFDHVRGKKLFNVADAPGKHSWEVIVSEIRKCEVRCANCHRRITFARRNHARQHADVA